MTLVKICGLTRPEDVALAVSAGAWACGFVLTDSPRQVSPARARDLGMRAGDALTVGVFGAEAAADVAATALSAGVRAVQLSAGRHGCTVAAVRAELAARRSRSHRADATAAVDSSPIIAAYDTPDAVSADLILFDARLPGRFGGTGATLDWRAVATRAGCLPADLGVMLAGGLSPTNVTAAIAAVRPRAVDVSGGVETAPGTKDRDALTAFIAAVHRADARIVQRPQRRRTGKESED